MSTILCADRKRKTLDKVSIEYLNECLRYDPESGKLFWRSRPFHHFTIYRAFAQSLSKVGKEALTTPNNKGYLHGTLKSPDGPIRLLAHRAAWALFYQAWPDGDVDHEDTDKTNNRIKNLREATFHQNAGNRPAQRNNKLGVKGVIQVPNGKFVAQIRKAGKSTHLGTFESIDAAHAAYKRAALREFGEFHRC